MWQEGRVSQLVLLLREGTRHKSLLFPDHRWPTAHPVALKRNQSYPESPQVPTASLLRPLWGRTCETIHESLCCWMSHGAGWHCGCGQERVPAEAPQCCPDPRSWAWSDEKTTCKYQLFVPFCCPTPFKYFYSEETFKQKQKTKIPHEPNRVSSEVWTEQAEHEALSYLRSDESDSDLVSLRCLSVPEWTLHSHLSSSLKVIEDAKVSWRNCGSRWKSLLLRAWELRFGIK